MLHQIQPLFAVQQAAATKVKLFADGASLADILSLYGSGTVSGFTTNPTLMRRAGVSDYRQFAQAVLDHIRDLPISFEVFSDELPEMKRQAMTIASWGDNVYVKIPITNTRGESCLPLIHDLSFSGVKVNATAILSLDQAAGAINAVSPETPSVISIFAGRIADTGIDPMPIMRTAVDLAMAKPAAEVLWASVREVLNVYQAEDCGCHIITSTADVLKKLSMRRMDLEQLSLETVTMFYNDASSAGYVI